MSDIFTSKQNGKRPRRVSSTRHSELVPPGVNVLVVDDNEVCLAITEAKLCHFGYTVFTAGGVVEAMSIVEDKSNEIHLVLAEARFPGTEKFEILEKLGHNKDTPIIVLTDDEDEDAMLEALSRGAFFYLVKPIPLDEVKHLWQFSLVKKREEYAARRKEKRKADVSAKELKESNNKEAKKGEEIRSDSATEASASEPEGRKSEAEEKEMNGEGDRDGSPEKQRRPKVSWTSTLHEKFLQAIDALGPERAYPKRILQHMNVPGLKKEHVSSHLQKYRLFLKREQEEAEKNKMLANRGSSSSAVVGQFGGTSLSLDSLSSSAVEPEIGGILLSLAKSSSLASVTKPGGIGLSLDKQGLPSRFNETGLSLHPDMPTTEPIRNELKNQNPLMTTNSPGFEGGSLPPSYRVPSSFSCGLRIEYGMNTGLPGSLNPVNSSGRVHGTQNDNCTNATASATATAEKLQLPSSQEHPLEAPPQAKAQRIGDENIESGMMELDELFELLKDPSNPFFN